MFTKTLKSAKLMMASTLIFTMAFHFTPAVEAKESKKKTPSYRTVVEVEDWGPVISKVIVNVGKAVPKQAISNHAFDVYVERSDKRLSTPLLEKGNRTVTKAYISDNNGNPVKKSGNYVALEMEIAPDKTLGSAMNFDLKTGLNDWVESKYIITQQQPIKMKRDKLTGLKVTTSQGEIRKGVEQFKTGKATYDGVQLTYADYTPPKVKGKEKSRKNDKKPLIIWLHGMGEGGTDPTVAIAGNKVVNFASKDIQQYFKGAYVLAPQTPTFWMDGFNGFGDGTSKYQKALMSLIQDYVAKHHDIDQDRIYIGGDSNGGYMTMLMVRDYKDYFAAAFVACEALKDDLITDEQIAAMKEVPMWFVAAKTDKLVPPSDYMVSTYNRLIKAGAKDAHMTLFDNVSDTSGLYKKSDGTPYEYDGHWSWIYVYNNEVAKEIGGKRTTIMEWLAAKHK
ncbi:putative peptidase [Paenibacillus turicensis]|uniref:Peptidase n=1 Tax=Paenibacillus turicensis TaxID=160487 RepID=A0ABS4FSU2_9BACL|nr:prolyl oligopeptidase family serine peptidase [Paenibacillus turicensis]MBP1905634.1 putative peptidase [Paenibacillus turicensis]